MRTTRPATTSPGIPRRLGAGRAVTLLVAAALAATGLSACSCDPAVSVSSGAVATSAPVAGAELDAAGFAASLKRPGTTVVDVRTPAEFAEGHLPGAVNIDVSSPDFASTVAQLDPTAAYAVYCRSGNRSAAAVAQMADLGFTGAFHLGGGIGAWQAAGGEVVTG
jgi:phage shock protein E